MRSLRLFAIVLFAALVFGFPTSVAFAAGTVNVKGYTRKDGTYVAPHTRSAPNSTKADNWSTKGNVNPVTGKVGTKSVEGAVASPSPPAAGKPASPSTGTQPSTPTASTTPKISAGWSSVHALMTKAEVIALLGSPNISTERKWIYPGGGSVAFDAKGTVVGFMAPSL